MDKNLLAVAATLSGEPGTISHERLKEAITQLSHSEGEAWLWRLAQGESNLSAKFRQKLSKLTAPSPTFSQPKRTIPELLTAASEEEKRAEEQRQKEAEAK